MGPSVAFIRPLQSVVRLVNVRLPLVSPRRSPVHVRYYRDSNPFPTPGRNGYNHYHNTAVLIESGPVTHSRSLLTFKTKSSTTLPDVTTAELGDKGLVVQLDSY